MALFDQQRWRLFPTAKAWRLGVSLCRCDGVNLAWDRAADERVGGKGFRHTPLGHAIWNLFS